MVSGSSALFIKHLPHELSFADREELLKLVGAVSVRVMPDNGKMKFCAFATFQNHEEAKYALSLLHQKEILGKRLVVEYASEKHQNHIPNLSDHNKLLPITKKEVSTNSERDVLRQDMENFSRKLHGISPALALDYLPAPLLKYKYPPPTLTIIQNISHALASVPKFYTQVLHLMNKMNLPAPFGPVTPAPPLILDISCGMDEFVEDSTNRDILTQENMDVTSEEESEYESESEVGDKVVAEKILPMKRQLRKPNQKRKRKKICHLPLPSTCSTKPPTEPSDVFESQPITQKKINMKNIDHITPVDSAIKIEPSGGFGAFEAAKVTDENLIKEPADEIWDDSQFITLEKLREKRISSREMKTMSIFRNFSPGEPCFRLYIKNLARQVIEKDLKYIFGRFVDRNSENDRNMFDIKLMKEGRMKGQAFVTLANENQAIKAVKETNGFVLHTKPMVVQFARSAKLKQDDKKGQKS